MCLHTCNVCLAIKKEISTMAVERCVEIENLLSYVKL